MIHKNVALVLGGGGAVGNAWLIGIVAGLAEAGIDMTETADLVIGTSAGATTAAQVRSGIPPAEAGSTGRTEPGAAAVPADGRSPPGCLGPNGRTGR
jgi:NTE family protein